MAKFCGNCGNKLKEEDKKCDNCGAAVVEEKNNTVKASTSSSNNTSTTKTNAFAIAGFITSITSIFFCGLSSVIGLILSIIGLTECNEKEEKGKGFAIAGIIIGAIGLGICAIILLVFGDVLKSMYLG